MVAVQQVRCHVRQDKELVNMGRIVDGGFDDDGRELKNGRRGGGSAVRPARDR